jgi:hypothetical protein
MPETPQYRTVDPFDRMMGELTGLPDVTHTKPTTIQAFVPLIGAVVQVTIVTFRQRERGDTIFLTYADADGLKRIHLPPAAADAIARQRDVLTTKVRKKVAKDQAAARKARGEVPAFMKGKK